MKQILVLGIVGLIFSLGTMFSLATLYKDELSPNKHDSQKKVYNFQATSKPTFDSIKTNELDKLLTQIEEERTRLFKKSDYLDNAERRINMEKKDLVKLQNSIRAQQKEFDVKAKEFESKRIAIAQSQTKNLKELAATYANMAPETAVSIFQQMEDDLAVKILTLMKPEEIGPIFEQMAAGPAEMTKRVARLSNSLRLIVPAN
tara:strand:+ start:401 stop:1009 length:609 start_codon:yes stop_codon:yes gene_type:complete